MDPHFSEQTQTFVDESWHYFQRNYATTDLRAQTPSPQLEQLLATSGLELPGARILDIGCGPGKNLFPLCRRWNARRGERPLTL